MEREQFTRPITICGLAGVGKSTAIKRLQKNLGYVLHSSGDFARQYACERFPGEQDAGKALAHLEDEAKRNRSIDLMIDQRTIDLAKGIEGKWILDSRLGWYFCPQAFKVLLACDTVTRLKRIATRDNVEFSDAMYATEHRESSIKQRYSELYGIKDFTSPHLFDCVVNTSVAGPEAVADQILVAFKEWNSRHTH